SLPSRRRSLPFWSTRHADGPSQPSRNVKGPMLVMPALLSGRCVQLSVEPVNPKAFNDALVCTPRLASNAVTPPVASRNRSTTARGSGVIVAAAGGGSTKPSTVASAADARIERTGIITSWRTEPTQYTRSLGLRGLELETMLRAILTGSHSREGGMQCARD